MALGATAVQPGVRLRRARPGESPAHPGDTGVYAYRLPWRLLQQHDRCSRGFPIRVSRGFARIEVRNQHAHIAFGNERAARAIRSNQPEWEVLRVCVDDRLARIQPDDDRAWMGRRRCH